MKGKIILAKKKDASRILELLLSDKNLYASKEDKATPEDVKQYLEGKTHNVFLYKINKKIAGLIIVQFYKISKFAYLNYIVVDSKYQRKGIAKILIKFLEKKAKKENYNLIELMTRRDNAKMMKFMNKLNYLEGDNLRFYYKKL
ncbi:MAG: GNAT family N-acetyltransferase [Candidatus Pacearchaeota archaeon]